MNVAGISGNSRSEQSVKLSALECRYPRSYFVKSYLRIALGVLALIAIGVSAPDRVWLSVGLLVLLAGLLIYALQTVIRQRTILRMDDVGLHIVGPRCFAMEWPDIKKVDLAYFSTRRDGSNGWMQFKIVGANQTLRIDSDLTDFDKVVVEALRQADLVGLDVGPATRHNAAVLCG